MFLIHPIFQSIGILIVLYVWVLGFSRFRSLHLKQKSRFNWKNHVRFAIIGTGILLMGIAGGLYMVKSSWHGILITGIHAQTGVLILFFILFAIGSGVYMDKKRKKRKILPLIHGISNTMLLLLSFSQVYTGIRIYRSYVLGF